MSRYLISVDELAACYRNTDVVIVDCRFNLADPASGENQYRAGHIPGSHYLHLDRDLSSAKAIHGGRHPLPAIDVFAERIRTLGINSAPPSLVVCYDDSRNAYASRLWWLLRYCGHDRIKVLDGGYAAWCAAKLPSTLEAPAAQRGNFDATPQLSMTISREKVQQLPQLSDAVLIDSREERRYLGLEEPIDPVAGHIPGAVNFPWQGVTKSDSKLLSELDQQKHWQTISDAREIAVYCGSGVTACVNLLSLAEIGRTDAKLYPGSWSDWCSYD